MKQVHIYAMRDPETDEVRYIGRSVNPEIRCLQHYPNTDYRRDNPKVVWLKSLRDKKLRPKIVILDTVPAHQAKSTERQWIKDYKARGFNLTNTVHVREPKAWVTWSISGDPAKHCKELARIWGESQTGTIARAIERAYQQEKIQMSRNTRETAESRIANTPELQPYRDLLVEYDWNEASHLEWVATAPISEIVDWAETIRQGEREQAEAGTGYAD